MTDDEQAATTEGRHGLITTEGLLFPATRLEYHFVDPHRRLLVKRAALDDGHLVVRSKDDGFDTDIATLATIVSYSEPSEERTVIKLEGQRRIRIRQIDRSGKFAAADWERLDSVEADQAACEAVAADILGILRRLSDAGIELAERVASQAADVGDAAAVADIVGSVTFDELDEQRELLTETDVLARLRRVEQRLGELVDVESE